MNRTTAAVIVSADGAALTRAYCTCISFAAESSGLVGRESGVGDSGSITGRMTPRYPKPPQVGAARVARASEPESRLFGIARPRGEHVSQRLPRPDRAGSRASRPAGRTGSCQSSLVRVLTSAGSWLSGMTSSGGLENGEAGLLSGCASLDSGSRCSSLTRRSYDRLRMAERAPGDQELQQACFRAPRHTPWSAGCVDPLRIRGEGGALAPALVLPMELGRHPRQYCGPSRSNRAGDPSRSRPLPLVNVSARRYRPERRPLFSSRRAAREACRSSSLRLRTPDMPCRDVSRRLRARCRRTRLSGEPDPTSTYCLPYHV
jgi:hypothetical protein